VDVPISQRTLDRLFEQATSFEDSVETVIERLLDQVEHSGTQPSKKELEEAEFRMRREGGLLPEGEYWLPILELLRDAGGSARGNDVIDALEERLAGSLGPKDEEVLQMGEVRWRNRARFARLRMKERGLIGTGSPRGIWEITDKGCEFVDEERRRQNTASTP
jgi:hypothetical protein